MRLNTDTVEYFGQRIDQHGAVALDNIDLPDERFITQSGNLTTTLVIARTSDGTYAAMVPADLTPKQSQIAHVFANGSVRDGWRILAFDLSPTVQHALSQAGDLLGFEVDPPTQIAADPAPPARPQNSEPPHADVGYVRVPSAAAEQSADSDSGQPKVPYTNDLTAAARQGKLRPVHGRDREIRDVLTILMQREKNNPMLVGEPGVGKTAVAEKLAIMSAQADAIPRQLAGLRVLSLNLASLVADSGHKGDLERNAAALLDAISRDSHQLLFVDEVHSLTDVRGDISLIDVLKPRLAEGLRLMGATTHAEYQTHIARDKALARRFATVVVEEPSPEETALILQSRLPLLESHHEIHVDTTLLAEIVRLSDEYFPDKRRPDKAITLLDRAMAAEALQVSETRQ